MTILYHIATPSCWIKTTSLDVATGFAQWIKGDIEFGDFVAIVQTHAPRAVESLPGLVETCMGTPA